MEFTTGGSAAYPKVEEERYLALLRAASAIATSVDCAAVSETLATQVHSGRDGAEHWQKWEIDGEACEIGISKE